MWSNHLCIGICPWFHASDGFFVFQCWKHPCIYLDSLDICSATSYHFGCPYRSKCPPLDILKFLVTAFINQYKKVAFIRVNEDIALARYSNLMKIYHNMNIIVQNMVGDVPSLNGKIEIPNKTLANITRALLPNSSTKKELWYFVYQYIIWISLWTDNMLRGDVPYSLWHGTRTSYKHIKIRGVRFYIINGRVTRKKLDDISHHNYFMGYTATTGVIIYWKLDHNIFIHRDHHVWFDEYNYRLCI